MAAEAMGIDISSMKLLAFVLGQHWRELPVPSPPNDDHLLGTTFWESIVLFTIVILGAWDSSSLSTVPS